MLGVYNNVKINLDQYILLKYFAGDTNESVINMWKDSQKGWKPPIKTSEKEYNKLKNSNVENALKGYIGHQYSYGGQFFNGYAPKYGKSLDSTRASKNVQNISKNLKNVIFKKGNYTQYSNLKGYIIYCDPPYENSWSNYNKKKSKTNFDITKFWEWCDIMSHDNIVFVSSYMAPKGLDCIFSSEHKLTGDDRNIKNKNRVEKLYLLY